MLGCCKVGEEIVLGDNIRASAVGELSHRSLF